MESVMTRGTVRRGPVLIAAGILATAGVVVGLRVALRGRAADPGAGAATAATGGTAAGRGTVVAVGVALAGGEKEEKGRTPIPVSVAEVGVGAVSSYITSTANLVPENEVKILAEAEGRVAELRVEEGGRVGKGEILATLAHDDAEIALKKAELKADNLRVARERAGRLVGDNLMSRESFDKIAMDDQVSQQELAEAKWKLEKAMIRAPFSGRITVRDLKLGQHVRPGDPLFTISDFDPLIARIYLPERDVLGLREGREVRITLKADERTRCRGRIRQISPVVDTATGTVKVTVEASAVPSEVRPGAFVTIDIVRETHAQAALLPREAIIRELQDAYVFVAKGEVAEKRTVSLGLEEGGRVEALTGISPGDRVIVAGQGGLKQGSPIKVVPLHQASDLRAGADVPTSG
jgi:membrane fusion protein (multidrug efflux system)